MIRTRINFLFDYSIRRVLALGEAFLFLRILLKFLAANPQAIIVSLLYQLTDWMVWPFQSIFPNQTVAGYFIDVVTFSAMVGYALGVFLLVEIVRALTHADPL